MAERRVSVRLTAVGGQGVKAELVGIGQEGSRALTLIEAAGPRAAAGLNAAGVAAGEAMRQMDELSARAARAATVLRQAGAGAGGVLDRINRSTGVSGGLARDAADIAAYGRSLDDLRARHNPLFATIRAYRDTLGEIRRAHAVGAISADEMAAAISRERQASLASIAALKGRSVAITAMGAASGMAGFRVRNLSFQLNDIAVSLAGGMNPFMVLAQQGSQVAQIYGFGNGGVGALFRDLGGMARSLGNGILGIAKRFPVVTAAIAATSLVLGGMRGAIEANTGAAVSFGEVATAAWEVFVGRVYEMGKPVFDAIASWFDTAVSWASWAWGNIVDGAIWLGNKVIQVFRMAAAGMRFAFETLPEAVGAAVIGTANKVIEGVNWMIQRVIGGINYLMEKANEALVAVNLTPVFTPFDPGAANIPTVPNPAAAGLGGQWRDFVRELRGIAGTDPLGEFFDDVQTRALELFNGRPPPAAEGGGGGASGGGAAEVVEEPEVIAAGWQAVADSLARYALETKEWGAAVGEAISSAFGQAEEAVAEFVKTGKVDFRELAVSIIADLAKIAFRQRVLTPLANWMSGLLGGPSAAVTQAVTSTAATILHAGGRAGSGRPAMLPIAALANAPRFHAGGGFRLGPEEHAAVLLRGERVLNRRQTREWEGGAGTQVNIYARDAESFRASKAQVAADVMRAVAFGRRSS